MARQSKDGSDTPPIDPDGSRPEPPEHLTAVAAEEWRALVKLKPAGFFDRGVWGLLEEHCELIATMRFHGEHIKLLRLQGNDGQGLDYKGLAFHEAQRAAAGAKLANVDTKLRLTKQATSSKDKNTAAPQTGWVPGT